MKSRGRLQFFQSDEEVRNYILSELIATLEDDYYQCVSIKDKETAKELKQKIHDIKLIELRIQVVRD
jgi:hypothetical protein